MAYQLSIEELDDIPVSPVHAASIEPMPKPDYKAKKHGRPVGQKPCAVRDRGRRVWADEVEGV